MKHWFSSTQRQVAFILAASLVLSQALVVLTVIVVFREREPHVPPGTAVALQVIGRLYASLPPERAMILQTAAEAGFNAVPADAALLQRCGVARSVPAGPAKAIPCPEEPGQPDRPSVIVPAGDTWLAAAPFAMHHEAPPHARHPWVQFYALVLGIALPTLVLSLWGSRRVTAPLKRLAAAAEAIEPDSPTASLPVSGTAEIRLLADSFNRLIERLQAFATRQRRMVAAVSHDLRTPLTRLRLRVDAVQDASLREKLVRDLDTMQIITDGSLSLVRAQENGITAVRVDLGALLQTIGDGFSDTGADVTVEGLCHLNAACDPAMLTRAIENLVENAVKFAGSALVTLNRDDRSVLIDIEDHGPGVPDADKIRVLEPYYRGDAARTGVDGTGLGLSIANAIAAAHGGTLTLCDAQPTGLRVRMTLPLAA